jgi:hypothetical protein
MDYGGVRSRSVAKASRGDRVEVRPASARQRHWELPKVVQRSGAHLREAGSADRPLRPGMSATIHIDTKQPAKAAHNTRHRVPLQCLSTFRLNLEQP